MTFPIVYKMMYLFGALPQNVRKKSLSEFTCPRNLEDLTKNIYICQNVTLDFVQFFLCFEWERDLDALQV